MKRVLLVDSDCFVMFTAQVLKAYAEQSKDKVDYDSGVDLIRELSQEKTISNQLMVSIVSGAGIKKSLYGANGCPIDPDIIKTFVLNDNEFFHVIIEDATYDGDEVSISYGLVVSESPIYEQSADDDDPQEC